MTHPTHDTYISDSSLYDEKCRKCGRTDARGMDELNQPCPAAGNKALPPDPAITHTGQPDVLYVTRPSQKTSFNLNEIVQEDLLINGRKVIGLNIHTDGTREFIFEEQETPDEPDWLAINKEISGGF